MVWDKAWDSKISHKNIQLMQQFLLKNSPFPIALFWHLCQKSLNTYVKSEFWTLFLFHCPISLFLNSLYYHSCIDLGLGTVCPTTVFWVFSRFYVHVNFRVIISISIKNVPGIFIEVALNLCTNFRKMVQYYMFLFIKWYFYTFI